MQTWVDICASYTDGVGTLVMFFLPVFAVLIGLILVLDWLGRRDAPGGFINPSLYGQVLVWVMLLGGACFI